MRAPAIPPHPTLSPLGRGRRRSPRSAPGRGRGRGGPGRRGALGLAFLGVAAGMPGFNAFHRLPGLAAMTPVRASYLFVFAAAALCGLGYDALLALVRRAPGRAAGMGGLLALLALPLGYLLA